MSDTNIPSDITGRKVFFLYPTASVENQIITELIQQEYEVYVAKNHANLSRALKKYSNSILFLNIDDGMSGEDWEKWINGILTALPEVKTGVLSSNTNEEFRENYINKHNITCGFTTLKLDMSGTIGTISEILSGMNAKGRRKYLRASTERETTATINMPHNGEFINGVVKDISTVGVSCAFENDPALKKNTLIKNVQIRLQTMLIKVELVVFGSRIDNGEMIYVMIFTQNTDPNVRVKIRKYIQQNLQNKMNPEIN